MSADGDRKGESMAGPRIVPDPEQGSTVLTA
jgi:hypothetical protein